MAAESRAQTAATDVSKVPIHVGLLPTAAEAAHRFQMTNALMPARRCRTQYRLLLAHHLGHHRLPQLTWRGLCPQTAQNRSPATYGGGKAERMDMLAEQAELLLGSGGWPQNAHPRLPQVTWWESCLDCAVRLMEQPVTSHVAQEFRPPSPCWKLTCPFPLSFQLRQHSFSLALDIFSAPWYSQCHHITPR